MFFTFLRLAGICGYRYQNNQASSNNLHLTLGVNIICRILGSTKWRLQWHPPRRRLPPTNMARPLLQITPFLCMHVLCADVVAYAEICKNKQLFIFAYSCIFYSLFISVYFYDFLQISTSFCIFLRIPARKCLFVVGTSMCFYICQMARVVSLCNSFECASEHWATRPTKIPTSYTSYIYTDVKGLLLPLKVSPMAWPWKGWVPSCVC